MALWCSKGHILYKTVFAIVLQNLLSEFKLVHYVLDNHDIISMKLYQLMVEHTPEEENLDWTKIEPSVSLLKSPKGK